MSRRLFRASVTRREYQDHLVVAEDERAAMDITRSLELAEHPRVDDLEIVCEPIVVTPELVAAEPIVLTKNDAMTIALALPLLIP